MADAFRNRSWDAGEGRHSPFPQDPHNLVGEADVGLDTDNLFDDLMWEGTQPRE